VGRLHPDKNQGLLIDAFALGPARIEGTHLILAGDGDLREQLTRQVATTGLKGRVHLLGLRDDIPDLLGASDAYVFASNHEGSPLSVMEAMAAGLPIIGTAVGGVSDLVPDDSTGILVPPGDPEALANAMRKVRVDSGLRASMARASAQRAAAFDIAQTAEAYAELYTTLVKRRP
jgi:glycosyltransferase involved in cell wall biosynthesis